MGKSGYGRDDEPGCFARHDKWAPDHGERHSVLVWPVLVLRILNLISLIPLIALLAVYINNAGLQAVGNKVTGDPVWLIAMATIALFVSGICGLLFYISELKWTLLGIALTDLIFFIWTLIATSKVGMETAYLQCLKHSWGKVGGKAVSYLPTAFRSTQTFANWFHGTQGHCMEARAILAFLAISMGSFALMAILIGFIFGRRWFEARGGGPVHRGAKNAEYDSYHGSGRGSPAGDYDERSYPAQGWRGQDYDAQHYRGPEHSRLRY